jgi:hypothetical protein
VSLLRFDRIALIAMTACSAVLGASDATYHVMWIILFNAVDDYGVREVNEVVRSGASPSMSTSNVDVEQVKREIMKETLHGALRIAGLVRILFITWKPNCSSTIRLAC